MLKLTARVSLSSTIKAVGIVGLLLLIASSLPAAEPARQPNIILIVADDLGYGETGVQGGRDIPTPHIDALANGGVRFTQGYVTAPFCAASRAALMTGRYQQRFGFEFNPIGAQNTDPQAGLPPFQSTFAQRLHDAGYATALIGKWHLGGTARHHPQRRGFDEFFGFLHEGHYYAPLIKPNVTSMLRRKTLPGGAKGRWQSGDGRLVLTSHMGHDEPPYDADNPLLRNGQPVDEPEFLTKAFAREACEVIRRWRDRPFLVCLTFNAVHSPLQAEEELLARFPDISDVHRRIFAAMVAGLDESVGQVIETLRENGLRDNTLIMFLSDNGGPTRELTSRNDPLRGEKGDLYEGGIRVPFLMNWPGHVEAGLIETRPVISVDLAATALAAAGLPAAKDGDGVDLLPVLRDQKKAAPHEVLFWRVGQRGAVRVNDWKLHRFPGRAPDHPRFELYDLTSDVAESKNLAEQMPARVTQLDAVWKQFNAGMTEPLWSPTR